MAVYTHLGAEDMAALIATYDVGTLVSAKGIAEGVSNSNWLIETTGRDGNGALRHSALVMRRGALAALLQDAAAIALKDRQLVLLKDAAGHRPDFPVYALKLSPRRTLIVAEIGRAHV